MTTISHMMPPTFEEGGWIRTLFESSDKVIGEPLKKRIDALMHRNDPYSFYGEVESGRLVNPSSGEKNEQNLWLIRAMAHTLGWNYTDVFQGASNVDQTAPDFNEEQLNLFTQDELLKAVIDNARFSPYKGTSIWVDFISYLLNINLDVRQLWYDGAETVRDMGVEQDNPTYGQLIDEEIIKAVDAPTWSPNPTDSSGNPDPYPAGAYVSYTYNGKSDIYRSRYPIRSSGGGYVSLPPKSSEGISTNWLELRETQDETSIRNRLAQARDDRRMIYGDNEKGSIYPVPYINIEIRPEDFFKFSQTRFENLIRKLIERMAPAHLVIHSYIVRETAPFETVDDPIYLSLVDIPAHLLVETGAGDSIQEVVVYGGSDAEEFRLEHR